MKKHESLAEKCKSASRNTFTKMGNIAAGNHPSDESKRGNMDIAPFSMFLVWMYERPAPKRKSK